MGELMFDKMKSDTRLAEEFLEAYKDELDLLIDDSQQGIARPLHEITKVKPDSGDISIDSMDKKLSLLAKKIEDNAELFAQLEALKRKVSTDDIKKYDIDLLVQNIKYLNNNQWYRDTELTGLGRKLNTLDDLVMGETTPLATLGIAMQYLCEHRRFTLQYCDATAAICYLFARLLRESGLDETFYSASFVYKKHLKAPVIWKAGCTGVVTEHSDVDSAVDALLASTSSPVECEWKLKRIYVQESVYKRFKETLSWKCNLKQSRDQACKDVSPQSAEVLIYEQKVFLLDYAGTLEQIEDTGHVILVEAYRTTKEMLSIVKKDGPFCVSLWSNDVSESNEIAYNLKVNIIWINDYGVFNGPLKVSQTLYNYLQKPCVNLKGNGADRVLKMAESWSKLGFCDRVEIIKHSLYICNDPKLDILYAVKEIMNSENNQTVNIEKGKMCVVIDEPNNLVFQEVDETVDDKHLIKMLTLLAHGSACIWTAGKFGPTSIENILDKLGKTAIMPVIDFGSLGELRGKAPSSLYKTRVVFSNYGTIFAN